MSDEPKFKVLIVDDEKSNLDVLNYILKTEYTVYIAKSGQAALKRAREDSPDIILLDIIMPDMSGFEVLHELKESDCTRNIPVIFITGLVSVDDEEKGFILGAVDYITKPFNNAIVKARIATHLKIVKQMRTIERLGMIDALTNIPNRRSFDAQAHSEWARAVRENTWLSMLIIDVDKFKAYNDTYGHPQGDTLLRLLAKVFESTVKRQTDFVARIGGEEFAVLLPITDLAGAKRIAEELRENAAATEVFLADDKTKTLVTISIGVAALQPTLQDSFSDFMAHADAALYTAKGTGRNRVCVGKDME